MKRCMVLLLTLVVAGTAFGADFRKTSWYMSKAQIVAIEARQDYEPLRDMEPTYEGIVYKVTVNGFEGHLNYYFGKKGLIVGGYTFANFVDTSHGLNTADFLQEFLKAAFSEMLSAVKAKYGEPTKVADNAANWDLPRTIINVNLTMGTRGFGQDDACYVIYTARDEYTNLLEAIKGKRDENF